MNFYGYYVLNLRPTILAYIGAQHPTPQWLRPQALIEHVPWWHGTLRSMLRRKVQQHRILRAGISHHLMVHAPDEDRLRRTLRVAGAYVSQNIYLDTTAFAPISTAKVWDAIYIAQLKRFKRHHLAKEIPRLLIIAAELNSRSEYQRLLPNAHFNDSRLTKQGVAQAINSACCTLALSRVEGGMLASFESLLCGIPVVSTKSKGGRDVFFDSQNSRIVAAVPAAIASAVAFFRQNPPDPLQIRAKALADLEPHRIRFCEYVSDLACRLGGARVSPSDRHERYFSAPGALSNLFIWADKLENPDNVRRIQTGTFIG